jgi:hypothetical protein
MIRISKRGPTLWAAGAFRKTYARREQTCLRAREMARLTHMYGPAPAVRCKRTSSSWRMCGLASMYPAFDLERVMLISARAIS